MIILVYADSEVILCPRFTGVKGPKEELKSLFKLKYLREVKYCMAVSFKILKTTSQLQLKYCSHILKQLGMGMAKKALTTVVENIKEFLLESVLCKAKYMKGKELPKRSSTGSLLFLSTHILLDIKFSLGILIKFVNCLTTKHCLAATRLTCYPHQTEEARIAIVVVKFR